MKELINIFSMLCLGIAISVIASKIGVEITSISHPFTEGAARQESGMCVAMATFCLYVAVFFVIKVTKKTKSK